MPVGDALALFAQPMHVGAAIPVEVGVGVATKGVVEGDVGSSVAQELADEILHGSASGQTGGVVALLAGQSVVPELAPLPQKVGTPHKMLPTVDKSSNPTLPSGNAGFEPTTSGSGGLFYFSL